MLLSIALSSSAAYTTFILMSAVPVKEIHRVLKPGGYFCFMEPHSGSFPDVIRKFWYKHDHFFSENEAAIDINSLEQEFASDFAFKRLNIWNPGFLFVIEFFDLQDSRAIETLVFASSSKAGILN